MIMAPNKCTQFQAMEILKKASSDRELTAVTATVGYLFTRRV